MYRYIIVAAVVAYTAFEVIAGLTAALHVAAMLGGR